MIKYIFWLSLLLWSSNDLIAQTKPGKLLASCCDTAGRGCNGSDYCTACTNCSGCKYCKSGGTCGVCRDRSTDVITVKRKEKKTPSGTKVKTVTITKKAQFYKDQLLYITATSVSLYEGPGKNYKIIETVKRGQRVIFIEANEPWFKVKSEKTGTVGYVHRDVLQ
ncbi:SH3 domain-containing protein [Flavobacterium sp. CAU 1735]|uniref:SH3 domain-containing protein n=1 Tax=Flavobacterium sp. CAU 1735 TaxID=3140361 RepID=UPI00326025BB